MLLFLTVASSSDALASDYLTKIGEPVQLNSNNGTWPRSLARETDDGSVGWWFVMARGGELYGHEMDADLQLADDLGTPLTGRSDLTDHGFAPCADGGAIDAASVLGDVADDTLVIFRFDKDLNLVGEDTPVAKDTTYRFNDAPAICHEGLTGAGGFMPQDPGAVEEGDISPFYKLNDDAETYTNAGDSMIVMSPTNFGASWIYDENNEWYINAKAQWSGGNMKLFFHDGDLIEVREDMWLELREPAEDYELYWPARMLYVDDHFYIVMISRDQDEEWQQDKGNVFIAILDAAYNIVELNQITNYEGPIGAFQPYMERQGSEILVTYTYDLKPYGVLIELDNAAPTADAGDDQTVKVGDTVTLDGTGSNDPDGEDITYAWSFVGVPDGSAADISGADSATATFVADVEGSYVVSLSVSDGGEPVDDAVIITATEEGGNPDSGEPTDDSDPSTDDSEGSTDDSGSTGDGGDGGDCGRCSTGPTAIGLLALAAIGLVRRRREDR